MLHDPPGRDSARYRWLLLVHLLPASPSGLRVRIWRRLQQIGALAVKQSVYVLPDSPNAREDFEWLRAEIDGAGGEATVFKADTVEPWASDTLVEEFRRLRDDGYRELQAEATRLLKRHSKATRPKVSSTATVARLRERMAAAERIDFFGSASREPAWQAIQQLDDRVAPRRGGSSRSGARAASTTAYRHRLWVTRPRPGVDRMASAWLITRFIDPLARFDFVADRSNAPADAVAFDMFGGEFSHRRDLCTYEALCETFHLDEPAIVQIAAIVHDLDLKDGRYGVADATTIGNLIDGLQLAHTDDQVLLKAGIGLFDALYRSRAKSLRTTGPKRPTPAPRKRTRRA